MTSEVAILNTHAVALAADSAVTVQYWDSNSSSFQKRYNKGANKLFNISHRNPVGLMIYGSANCQGVPWELLAKTFRDELGDKSHESLGAYAKSFFDFVQVHKSLFTPEFLERQFKSDVERAASRLSYRSRGIAASKLEAGSVPTAEQIQTAFGELVNSIQAAEFIGNAKQADLDDAVSRYSGQIASSISTDASFVGVLKWLDANALSNAAIHAVFKRDYSTLDNTGVVVAGYGDKDYFPRIRSYRCHGHILSRLVTVENPDESADISQDQESQIFAFAQSDMINTFRIGLSEPGFINMAESYSSCVDQLIVELRAGGYLSAEADIGPLLENSKTSFVDKNFRFLRNANLLPLNRAVSMLSVGELAELAETLVSLESLKERVTQPSDSIGGPVDVAVISKSDGFIWMKRKHYFDPALNSRYFARKGIR